MSDDPRGLRLAELELSLRSSELLQSLPVTTVGELVDLPEIVLPQDWPPRTAKLVAAEILELLASLGGEYPGRIRGPEPKSAELVASGTVRERWNTIETWLKANHAEALEQFNPPAPAAAIAEAEAALGVELPRDYKEFLALHNGQDEFAPFVGLGALMSIEGVVKRHASLSRNASDEEFDIPARFVGPGVRARNYCRKWIAITESARGRDFLCLDLDPASDGVHGQIIEYVLDGAERPLVAQSFADLLSKYFEQAQTGDIVFDD